LNKTLCLNRISAGDFFGYFFYPLFVMIRFSKDYKNLISGD